jgi:hypothetical protein
MTMRLLRKDGTWYYNDSVREALREAWDASLAADKGRDLSAARARARALVAADVARTAKHWETAKEEALLAAAIEEAEAERMAMEASQWEKRRLVTQRSAEAAERRKAVEAIVAMRRKELAAAAAPQRSSSKVLAELAQAVHSIRGQQARRDNKREAQAIVEEAEMRLRKWRNENEAIEDRRQRLAVAFEKVLVEQAPTTTVEELDFLHSLHCFLQDKNAFHEWEEGHVLQLVPTAAAAAKEEEEDVPRLTAVWMPFKA